MQGDMTLPSLEGRKALYFSGGQTILFSSQFYFLESKLFPVSIYKVMILYSLFRLKSNEYYLHR